MRQSSESARRTPEGTDRRKLRVVTLVDGMGVTGGGAERLAREIVTRLDRDRFERTLCVSRCMAERESSDATRQVLADLRAADVRLLALPRRSAADFLAWRPLLATLRQERVDILHAHQFGSNVWAAILGPLARTPVVIAHEHTWSFEGERFRKLLDRELIARSADAFLTVSDQDRRRMIEIEGINPDKLILVPNGIAAPAQPGGGDVRAELGIEPEAPVIGTVCKLRPQKALEVLVEAARILVPRFPLLQVLIVGEGPERPALERRIEEIGLDGTVRLVGYRNDIANVLAALDLAVCCSDFEGTPLSILEYMEAGLPVVATRVGGVPDLITPDVHGLLVDSRDPAGLAAAVGELLDDSARATAMGADGRARRRAEFDISLTVAEIERIYEGLTQGTPAGELGLAGKRVA